MFKNVLFPPSAAPVLTEQEFEQFRALAQRKFGLHLTDSKHELVAARLAKKLRELHLPTYRAYYEHVAADKTGESLVALIDALSTNYTSFLREASHFNFLRDTVLPALSKRPRIDVWSAPCSTGEEPYTIAITLFEALGLPPRPEFRIRATDISTRALGIAQRGVYQAQRLSGVPMPMLRKYFVASSGVFEIHPELRKRVEFARVNLIEPLIDRTHYPVIFCRNLLIYFDKPTQERVVNQLAARLEPGGYLFIGHSESLMSTHHPLEYVAPAIYRLPGGRGAQARPRS